MIALEDMDMLFTAARQCAPFEMCGLLFKGHPLVFCHNVSDHPEHEFEIAHEDYLAKVALYGTSPWATVHSHPNGEARLSPKDCQLLDALEMVNNPMKMLIVGLKPMEIRVFSKVNALYTCEWEWEIKPMEAKTILYAENN